MMHVGIANAGYVKFLFHFEISKFPNYTLAITEN
jgi:hypothetical protein